MARLRSGSRTMGGPMRFVVSTTIRLSDGVRLPPDRYEGTVEWEERLLRSGFERSKKRYRLRVEAEDLARWGCELAPGEPFRLVDITAEVASGDIGTL